MAICLGIFFIKKILYMLPSGHLNYQQQYGQTYIAHFLDHMEFFFAHIDAFGMD